MFPRDFFLDYWNPSLRNELFVAMPFTASFESIWKEAIIPAANECGLNAFRVDLRKTSDSILVDILDGIAHAKLLFVDVSPVTCSPASWFRSLLSPARRPQYPNGNVMYELGLAHASRQAEEVILVRNCSETLLLFDVSSVRVHYYPASDMPGSRSIFSNLIRDALAIVDRTKSLQVAKAIQAITVSDIMLIRKFWPNAFYLAPKDSDDNNLNNIPSNLMLAAGNLQKLGLVRTQPLSKKGNISINLYWTEFGNAVVNALGSVAFQKEISSVEMIAKPENPKAEGSPLEST